MSTTGPGRQSAAGERVRGARVRAPTCAGGRRVRTGALRRRDARAAVNAAAPGTQCVIAALRAVVRGDRRAAPLGPAPHTVGRHG